MSQPQQKAENDELRRAKTNAEEKLRAIELSTSTHSLKIEQLNAENEKLRTECLQSNVKIQEHLGYIRVAETSVDHFKKMYEAERDSATKLRLELDEERVAK